MSFSEKIAEFLATPEVQAIISAAIAYICKANDVECVVIKGISDFPINENESTKEDSHEEQLNVFLTNIPIIMNNILDNYLEFAIKNKLFLTYVFFPIFIFFGKIIF